MIIKTFITHNNPNNFGIKTCRFLEFNKIHTCKQFCLKLLFNNFKSILELNSSGLYVKNILNLINPMPEILITHAVSCVHDYVLQNMVLSLAMHEA